MKSVLKAGVLYDFREPTWWAENLGLESCMLSPMFACHMPQEAAIGFELRRRLDARFATLTQVRRVNERILMVILWGLWRQVCRSTPWFGTWKLRSHCPDLHYTTQWAGPRKKPGASWHVGPATAAGFASLNPSLAGSTTLPSPAAEAPPSRSAKNAPDGSSKRRRFRKSAGCQVEFSCQCSSAAPQKQQQWQRQQTTKYQAIDEKMWKNIYLYFRYVYILL